MRETTPHARLIAEPKVRWGEVFDYLAEVDGLDWYDRVHAHGPGTGAYPASDAELLVEFAGRRCYRSWAPGLNANVTKVREDSGAYLGNILASKHGAVLEHAQFTFDFADVSRVFTHELVRHRAGVAISQESLRYVRLTDLGFRIPDVLEPHRDTVVSVVERLEEVQRDLAEAFGLDDEGVPFHYKKEVTSALRRLAPIGLSTGMVWSANVRTLRHVIAQRTAAGAEEEIRTVFGQVAEIMRAECPLLFGDIERQDDGSWAPQWDKV
jgi:thymidylate synthase (FAD)